MKEISRRITNYFCKYEEISIYSEEVQFAIYQILWGMSTFFIALIGVYIFQEIFNLELYFQYSSCRCVGQREEHMHKVALSVLVLPCVCLLYLHIIIIQA